MSSRMHRVNERVERTGLERPVSQPARPPNVPDTSAPAAMVLRKVKVISGRNQSITKVTPLSRQRDLVTAEHLGLAARERGRDEARDHVVEQTVPVDLGLQMEKDGAEPDRGAVHDHELARHVDPEGAGPCNCVTTRQRTGGQE